MALLRTAERTAVASSVRSSRLGRDFWLGYALTLPAFLVVVGLVAYPLGYAFWLSLQDIKVGGRDSSLVSQTTRGFSLTVTVGSTASSGTASR